IIGLLLVSGCQSQTQRNCENSGGNWNELPSGDCCCPSQCVSMTYEEMAQNLPLCECCLRL
ncbi:unnamed protein product, partial [marine sediment metagenome]